MARRAWTTREEKRMTEMRESGSSHAEIAAELGRTTIAVKNRLSEMRRKIAEPWKNRHRWKTGDIELLRAMRGSGATVKEIASALGVTSAAVNCKLRDLGIRRRKK